MLPPEIWFTARLRKIYGVQTARQPYEHSIFMKPFNLTYVRFVTISLPLRTSAESLNPTPTSQLPTRRRSGLTHDGLISLDPQKSSPFEKLSKLLLTHYLFTIILKVIPCYVPNEIRKYEPSKIQYLSHQLSCHSSYYLKYPYHKQLYAGLSLNMDCLRVLHMIGLLILGPTCTSGYLSYINM